MELKNTQYIPESSLTKNEMKQMQVEIGEKAVFTGENVGNETVVGIDQAFTEDNSASAAVAMKDGEIVEKVSASEPLEMPYIPGLLAFREAPAMISALKKMEVKPDILMVDGSGRIDFCQAGIATHIGVLFDKPAIGVAKNLLCGQPEENLNQKFQEAEKIKISTDKSINTENSLIGYAFQSKQYQTSNRSINPLIVSPGHKINAENSVKQVAKHCKNHKLPEPTRQADKYVNEIKEKY